MRRPLILALLILSCRAQERVEPAFGDTSASRVLAPKSLRRTVLLDRLKTPSGDHPPMKALIGPPQTIFPGPSDDEYVSYIGTYDYTLTEASPKKATAILKRLQEVEQLGLWDYRTIDSWRFQRLPRASFVRSVPLHRGGVDGYFINMEDSYSIEDRKTKRMILGDKSWASHLGDYDGGVAWFVFDISVTGSGIPGDLPDGTATPLAFKIGSRVLLAVEEYDRDEHGPLATVADFDFYDISVDRNSKRDWSSINELLHAASKSYLQAVADELKQQPFNADIDHETPTAVMLTRVDEKNDLLDGMYETTGYIVNTSISGSGIRLWINLNVLAANHPDNPPADPPRANFQRYKVAVSGARSRALARTCAQLGGTLGTRQCVLR